jgi:amidophosphoribosyltransferase
MGGRSFIEPTPELRQERILHKFHSIRALIEGQRVVVVDDSVVRFNTLPHIVSLLRDAGAEEVHCRIAAPLITHSCHYGIYTPTREELVANRMSVEAMRKAVGANSLEFLPLEVLRGLNQQNKFCYACMDGKYPPFLEP